MRKTCCWLAIICLLFVSLPAQAAGSRIQVFYEGNPMTFETDPIIQDGTTMVPFRAIFEELGMEITWEAKTKHIRGEKGTLSVDLYIGSKTASVNNKRISLEVAPVLIDGTTMVPLRFVAEASGKTVQWVDAARSVYITKGYEADPVVKPYGGKSFMDDAFTGSYYGGNSYIYENDGYLYVMWYQKVSHDNKDYGNFYVSVAKDGEWIKRSQVMAVNRMYPTVDYKWTYANGSFYWMNSDSILKITATPSGAASVTQMADDLDADNVDDEELVKKKYDDDETAVDEDNEDNLRSKKFGTIEVDGVTGIIFFATEEQKDGDDEPVIRIYDGAGPYHALTVLDKQGTLKNTGTDATLSYDSSSKVITIENNQIIKRLDASTGEWLSDSDSGSKPAKVIEDAKTIKKIVSGGKIYYLYQPNGDTKYYLASVDEYGDVTEGIPTQIKGTDLSGKTISIAENSIHLWRTYLENKTYCIELTSFSL